MHFSSLLATAAMALSASAAPLSSQDADNWAKCANKTPDVAKAIELFCITNNKDNSINVPSLYTEFGYAYGGARVSITNGSGKNDGCPHSEWVPSDICLSQFWLQCAQDPSGWGQRLYGSQVQPSPNSGVTFGCQRWNIGPAEIK